MLLLQRIPKLYRSLTDTYVNAKKRENELKSENKKTSYKWQCFYEGIIKKIKEENEREIHLQEEMMREEYEERLRGQTERKGEN